jgi:tetratricopeptide (TPR) repeat protein
MAFGYLLFTACVSGYAAPTLAPIDTAQAAMQRFEESMVAMEAAWLASKPEEAARHADEARAHAHEALNAFEDAHALTANDIDLITAYARACAMTDNWDIAAKGYARALEMDPAQGSIRISLGEALFKAGPAFREQAFTVLRDAIDDATLQGAGRAQATRLLGDVYWENGLYDAAKQAYEAALEKEPGDMETALRLAAAEAREGNMAGASARLDALGRRAQPFDAEIRGRLRTALYEFEQMRRTFPETAAEHEGYGRLLYRAARIPESILPLRRALSFDPGNTQIMNFLGDVQWQVGNTQAAISALEQSLEAQPDQPQLREKLQAMKEAVKPPAGS